MTLAGKLAQEWRSQLQTDLPGQANAHGAIVSWLLGENQEQFDTFSHTQLDIARQAMDYRYRILRDRYLNASPERAYRNLIQRLSGLFLLRNKIKTWISLSRDRQRTVVDVLQEVIQELMQQDSYLQQQTAWISQCTPDPRLRNALVLAATEEYCLRPIRNQPLLMYRFVNYLRRSQRGGMTQVPTADFIRLVSEEVNPDDADGSVSLLDGQAISEYQDAQAQAQQQEIREAVVDNLAAYLDEKVGPEASEWLKLYLQGKTQETIAEALNMPIKQVYRLREKVSYHAIKVFATKKQPELVAEWLGG
ncbi:HetZ-related protein 2 [Alkalinema sp. FACHB-956]|uniref:HetZ-related protein 2 n=1 Tax=Alkalinema sp. FACHB-956 TaxID=2692768 RepID=UPI001688E266|nr:HetZ-related protein 2 [Alkalinema sp. FACHB-956]MBD2328971.1 HetZ-related protein 2 [Alkalinema sp. FACHB-956]